MQPELKFTGSYKKSVYHTTLAINSTKPYQKHGVYVWEGGPHRNAAHLPSRNLELFVLLFFSGLSTYHRDLPASRDADPQLEED